MPFGNENLGLKNQTLVKNAQDIAVDNVENAIKNLLDALRIDWYPDPNMKETPRRVAKMLVHEALAGRYDMCPDIKDFPNTRSIDQIYTVGPVAIRSMCSHHLVPIVGKVWFGILPNKEGKIVGLSKFSRIANWIFRRAQIQEEATGQLTDLLENALKPVGLALVVKAQHLCTSWRGVQDNGMLMVTSAMRGVFKNDGNARQEFFNIIRGQGYESSI